MRDLNLTVTGGLLPDADVRAARRPRGRARALVGASATGSSARPTSSWSASTGAYRELARAEPERIVALDGVGAPRSSHEEIREHVRALL